MYKNGFGINNLQWLMCHKTKPNQINLIQKDSMQVHLILLIYTQLYSLKQLFLFNENHFYTQLNCFKYSYLTPAISNQLYGVK